MAEAVNLPITLGGFSFKGVHSSEFGVRQTPGSRVLSPKKNRSLINIPGRSTAVIQEDGGYEPRVETITCTYVLRQGENLQRQVRLIAGWLDGVGELVYDYEPEMHYIAFLSNTPPTVKQLEFAQFELEFTCNSPFAFENPETVNVNLTSANNTFTLSAGGTVDTPVRLIIKNTGSEAIESLTIIKKNITN